jgi:hypothetical protein
MAANAPITLPATIMIVPSTVKSGPIAATIPPITVIKKVDSSDSSVNHSAKFVTHSMTVSSAG